MDIGDIVICKNKSGDICSMGIPIESNLIDNDVFFLNKKTILNDTKPKNIFRKNLGIPLPLFLIKNQSDNLLNIDNSLDKNNTDTDEIIESFVDNDLFEKLLRLAEKPVKKSKTRKKKLKKKNNKTRKKKLN
tara:strand:- start:49354 stop:49749 length:396 start_codon:yes stop_codon:yes gene_type:complete